MHEQPSNSHKAFYTDICYNNLQNRELVELNILMIVTYNLVVTGTVAEPESLRDYQRIFRQYLFH